MRKMPMCVESLGRVASTLQACTVGGCWGGLVKESWAVAGSVWRACWRCTSTATPAAPQRCARPRARRSAALCSSRAARGALCAVERACIDRSPEFSLICERLTTTADSPRALRRRARASCAARLCGGARRASAGLALSPLLNALEKRGRRRGRRAERAARCALARAGRRGSCGAALDPFVVVQMRRAVLLGARPDCCS